MNWLTSRGHRCLLQEAKDGGLRAQTLGSVMDQSSDSHQLHNPLEPSVASLSLVSSSGKESAAMIPVFGTAVSTDLGDPCKAFSTVQSPSRCL